MSTINDGLIIDRFGTKYWFKDGEWHRIDGPAVEFTDGTKWWFLYGQRHRIGGPAIELSNGVWWLYGEQYSEEEYNKWMSNLPLLYWNRFKKGKWL